MLGDERRLEPGRPAAGFEVAPRWDGSRAQQSREASLDLETLAFFQRKFVRLIWLMTPLTVATLK